MRIDKNHAEVSNRAAVAATDREVRKSRTYVYLRIITMRSTKSVYWGICIRVIIFNLKTASATICELNDVTKKKLRGRTHTYIYIFLSNRNELRTIIKHNDVIIRTESRLFGSGRGSMGPVMCVRLSHI